MTAGHAQINIGAIDTPGAFINHMKCLQSVSFDSGATPAYIDSYGYPVGNLPANVGGTILLPSGFCGNSVDWVVKWPSTRNVKFVINTAVTVQSASGASVTGGSNSALAITSTGVDGRVVFRFNDYVGADISFYFRGSTGFIFGGTGELAMLRASDEAAYDAGEYFTPEFIAELQELNPKVIRTMGWVNSGDQNVCTLAGYDSRMKPANVSWHSANWISTHWVGTISGTDNKTCSAATDTPESWTHLEQFQGLISAGTVVTPSNTANNGSGKVRITVNSTATLSSGQEVWIFGVNGTTEANGIHTITVVDSTHIDLDANYVNSWQTSGSAVVSTQKIDVGGRGAKWLANSQGVPWYPGGGTSGYPTTNTPSSFTYDALLDRVLWSSNGYSWSVPIEVQVQLANRVQCDLWVILPANASDDYVTQTVQYVADNLDAGLGATFEYDNEVWNFRFPQTQLAFQRGLILGFPASNDRPSHGWYGLRFRQIMEIVTDTWGARPSLKRIMAFQNAGSVSDVQTYRAEGTDLVTSNSAYNAWVGVSYNAAPDRPIDFCDALSPAHYYRGATMNNGAFYDSMPTANKTALQDALTAYNSGDTATALAWLDDDIRQGTRTDDGNPHTLKWYRDSAYSKWEGLAADYDHVTVEPYEGGLEIVPPTEAQLTTLGITVSGSAATAATAAAALVEDYKNSEYAFDLVQDQFKDFLALPHSRTPSWLSMTGRNQWSLRPGDIFSEPYQTYDGFAHFNNNPLSRRWVLSF